MSQPNNAPDAQKLKHPSITITIIALSYLLLIADGSIAVTALPAIKHQMNISTTTLSWVQNSYSLAFGGLLLFGARIGDVFGRLKMFVFGLIGFITASLIVGIAPNAGILFTGRVLQGVAGAILAPSTLALLSTAFPKNPGRAKALSIYSSITGIGTTFGLVLGGFITNAFSWRWAFLINLPIGILLALAAKKYLFEIERHQGRIDYLGAVFSTLGMSSLVFGLVKAADLGWSNSITISSLMYAVVILALFVAIESRTARPLMPLHLLKSRHRSGSNFSRFLFVGSMAGYWFFVSQFLQIAKGYSPLQAGFAFLPMTLASFGIAFLIPSLTRKFGDSKVLITGLITVMTGTLWLSRLTIHGSFFWQIAVPLMLVGLGQGASTIRLTTAAMQGVSPHDAGAASGIVSTAVQLGSAFGLSLLLSIATTVTQHDLSTVRTIEQHTRIALASGGGLIAIALLSALIFVVRD